MNYTTNFNLNKPEGTDLYNHLTIDNPNMDTIDAAMQANKIASVGAATELVSGTVHAITRSDSNQNIFKFKATGDFKAGDTITVDGVSVSAYTTGGQQLLDDAYVLSAEVLCILDNTSLWVLVNKTPEATDIPYNSVNSIKDELDEVNNTLNDKLNTDRVFSRMIGYNANAGAFLLPQTAPRPSFQISLIVRNQSTGAMYAVWYDSSITGFKIETILSGAAPTNNQACAFWYVV